MKLRTLFLALGLSLVLQTAEAQFLFTTLIVDTTADDPGLSSCNASVPADCSLRGALAKAATLTNGVLILFDTSAVNFLHPITLSSTLTVNQPNGSLTISADTSGFSGAIVSGNNSARVFDITGGTVTLTALTISNGRTSGSSNAGSATRLYVRSGERDRKQMHLLR